MSRWIPGMLLAGWSVLRLAAQDPTHLPPPAPPQATPIPGTAGQDPTHLPPPPPPPPPATTTPTATAPGTTTPAKPQLEERTLPKTSGKEQAPPEEDKSFLSEEHSFNPLQSQKSIEVGDHYMRNGKLQGAIYRYQDATLWNEGNAEAWRKLGQAEEKINDRKAAKDAYDKYLSLAGDAREAAAVRKKIASWGK